MILTVNGKKVLLTGTPPELRNGKVMVPLDALCSELGVAMHYDRSSAVLKLTPTP